MAAKSLGNEKFDQAPKISTPHKNIQITLYAQGGVGINRMGVGKSLYKNDPDAGRRDRLCPTPVLRQSEPFDEAIMPNHVGIYDWPYRINGGWRQQMVRQHRRHQLGKPGRCGPKLIGLLRRCPAMGLSKQRPDVQECGFVAPTA
jgi:hypothetical protein